MGLSQTVKSLEEQVKSLEEQHVELRKQIEGTLKSLEVQQAQHREVVLKLSERTDELNNTIVSKEIEIRQLQVVRRNKLKLLNEFKYLYATFNHQMRITVPPRKRIPKCKDPSDVKRKANEWIMDFDKMRIQNCDINARLCFAMLVGGYDNLWVEKDTQEDESLATSIENAIKVKALLFSSDNAIFLIRFVDKHQTDGHSLVLLKLGTTLITFQAYYGIASLDVFDGDVTSSIFDKITSGNISMNSTSFGFTKSSRDWDVHSECFIYYKLL